MLGTGFNGALPGTVGYVLAFGNFVGGFFANNSTIQLAGIHLQAICGAVPGGSAAADHSARAAQDATYKAKLRQAQAAFASSRK